ncbi:hypothetical protein [Pedobacter frigoris]|uniref:TlpA family protein disulfide reductase n=1 Tax=Pedobacter frigoris TaxID=2571272 RepID=UPI00292F1AD2|nr:hypothetical protein [Pedobacter frigoris]
MRSHLLILTILFLGTLSCQNGEMPQSIPEFSIKLPDTTKVFHSKDIPYGKTIVLIQFDPACRECQEETEYILANMQNFAHTNIYMVTRHSYDELMVFYNHLKLDTCRNIIVGIEDAGILARKYNTRGTPLTLVYNKDKYLIGQFVGKPEMSDLKKIIN